MSRDVTSAGSVFRQRSCESAEITLVANHTFLQVDLQRVIVVFLLDSFVKKITFQQLDGQGVLSIGGAVEIMVLRQSSYMHTKMR